MIRSRHCGHSIHCDIVNPRLLELQAAKEILAELYDIQISEVEDLIKQHIADFQLSCMEFELYTDYRKPCLS
jgi:hypothetical protein